MSAVDIIIFLTDFLNILLLVRLTDLLIRFFIDPIRFLNLFLVFQDFIFIIYIYIYLLYERVVYIWLNKREATYYASNIYKKIIHCCLSIQIILPWVILYHLDPLMLVRVIQDLLCNRRFWIFDQLLFLILHRHWRRVIRMNSLR